jgi:hypothetical protein
MSLTALALHQISKQYEKGSFDAAYVSDPDNIESFHFLANVPLIWGKTTFETLRAIKKLEQDFEGALADKDIVLFLPLFFKYHMSTNSCLKLPSFIHRISANNGIPPANAGEEINAYVNAILAVFRKYQVAVDESSIRMSLYQLKFSNTPQSPYNITFSPFYFALRVNNPKFLKVFLEDAKLTQNQKFQILNTHTGFIDRTIIQSAAMLINKGIINEVLNTPHLTSEQKFILLSTRSTCQSAFEFAALHNEVASLNLANTIFADILRSKFLSDLQKLSLLKIKYENRPYESKSALHLAANNLELKNFILKCLPRYKPVIKRLIREIKEGDELLY